MHTTRFQFVDILYKPGSRMERCVRHFAVIHNGDWSGDVELLEIDPSKPETDKKYVIRRWKDIPGGLLVQIGRKGAFDDVIRTIEQME